MIWQQDQQLLERLLALADGELAPQDRPAVLAFLAEHPDAARWLAEQAQLATMIRQELTDHANPTPAPLRQRVQQMTTPARRLPRPVHLNWLAAVAATIAICWLTFRGSEPSKLAPPIGAVVPANIVAHASRVHDDCSRAIQISESLHDRPFPPDHEPLARSIERDIGRDQPIPDLSSIGFRFVGAGPCGAPIVQAAHLLYRTDRPHSSHTISVFVQPFSGQFPMELNRVYTLSVEQSPFPMLAWRSESVVYFLLADDEKTEQAALALIHK